MDQEATVPAYNLTLPRGPHGLGRETVDAVQYERLIRAMLETVADRGYARTTVSDVVAAARVSKSAFYKLFKDRDDCFAAAHRIAIDLVEERLAEAVSRTDGQWRTLLSASLTAYLEGLASEPLVARALHSETLGAGPAQTQLRRDAVGVFVTRMRRLHALAREQDPEVRALPESTFLFLVGGIDSVIQEHLRTEPDETLVELAPALIGSAAALFTWDSTARP